MTRRRWGHSPRGSLRESRRGSRAGLRPGLRLALLLGLLLGLLSPLGLLGGGARQVTAQQPDATARITGTITNGSTGSTGTPGVRVQLITLDPDGEITSVETTVDAAGRYRFDVLPDPALTHLPRVVYEGIQYIGLPLLLSDGLPEAEQDFTVYDLTAEAPALTITTTTTTILLIERSAGEIAFVREDIVHNPSNHVFAPPGGGITLRLPLPNATIEGVGLSEEGDFAIEGQTLTTNAPFRPGDTVVVTRYVVGYDPADDGYRLRMTAPLTTGRATIRVPERFADHIEPLAETLRTGEGELEGEPLVLLGRDEVEAGQSVTVELRGFVPRNDPNPLTEGVGATAAAIAAAAIVGAAVVLMQRRERTPETAPTPTAGTGAEDDR